MPPSPLLVRATIIAIAVAPLVARAKPPVDPADHTAPDAPTEDDGVGPVRVVETEQVLQVSADGVGPTPESALADARRKRDRAIVERIRAQAHALQLQDGAFDGPTEWPGGEVLAETTHPTADGHIAHVEYRIADRRVLTERIDVFGQTFAYRLQPRRGVVLLTIGPQFQGLRPGDVLADPALEDPAVLRARVEQEQPLPGERDGVAMELTPHFVPVAQERDLIRRAPTCGPCCHSPGACGPDRTPWGGL